MKTVGIVGGLGPESTIEYYRLFHKLCNDKGRCPRIIIDSLDLSFFYGLMNSKQYKRIIDYLSESISNLAEAGADFAAIASNTPHIVFDHVQEKSPIPLVSIVDATYQRVKNLGLESIGLLGTKFTMEGDFFKDIFEKNGIQIVVPIEKEQDYLQDKIYNELVYGVIRQQTKEVFLEIIDRMMATRNIKGVILGCTELPLILKEGDGVIPFLNTTSIHVESIVNFSKV